MIWPHELPAPAVQRAVDTRGHSMLEQIGATQLGQWQRLRLQELLGWLIANVPWWSSRVQGGFARLPVLSHKDLSDMLAMNGAAALPAQHGAALAAKVVVQDGVTQPYFTSAPAQRMMESAHYADHVRQGRDPFGKLVCISDDVAPHGGPHLELGASLERAHGVQWLRRTSQFSAAEHLEWLANAGAVYLVTDTVTLDALTYQAQSHGNAGKTLPALQQVMTAGEAPTDELRSRVRKLSGASIRHRFTHPMAGPLAFQCPQSNDHFHGAVGNVLLESARAKQGNRLLVTALHHYATPMLRLDVNLTGKLHPVCPVCGTEVPTLHHAAG
jgi:phenylacetate-coenzyme A ligase PaaK-like adenylate-forming protein